MKTALRNRLLYLALLALGSGFISSCSKPSPSHVADIVPYRPDFVGPSSFDELTLIESNLAKGHSHTELVSIDIKDHRVPSTRDEISYSSKTYPTWLKIGAVFDGQPSPTSFDTATLSLHIKLPGGKPSVIPIRRGVHGLIISEQALGHVQSQTCPIDFSSSSLQIFRDISVRRPDLTELTRFEANENLRTAVSFGADRILYSIRCSFAWTKRTAKDGFYEGYRFTADVKLALVFEKPVFFWGTQDVDNHFERLFDGKPALMNGGKGIRFFTVREEEATADSAPNPINHWNLVDKKIVIDDIQAFDGRPFAQLSYGLQIQKSLRAMTRDLRHKFPELGARIILKSEPDGAALQPNLFLSHAENDVTSGMSGTLIDTDTGEIVAGRISFTAVDGLNRIVKYYKDLQKLGLLENVEAEIEAIVNDIIAHEFGHVLGLTHNMLAHRCENDGSIRYTSVMTYTLPALIPPTFALPSGGYGRHDILGLKYLYAPLMSSPVQERQEALNQLKRLDYSETGNEFGGDGHSTLRSNAARCWVTSRDPRLESYRRSAGNQWLQAIAAAYKASSGKEFPDAGPMTANDDDTSKKAFSIIASIDYLPFQYLSNGCYDRQLYMSMELAAQGIPASAQYALGSRPESLRPFLGEKWNWHVATMIWAAGAPEPTIFDPSFSKVPLTRSEWVKMLKPTADVSLFWNFGSNYVYSDESLLHPGPTSPDVLPNQLNKLPTFQGRDIASAASETCGYLSAEPGIDDSIMARKKAKLTERTRSLAKELEQRGLISPQDLPALTSFECW